MADKNTKRSAGKFNIYQLLLIIADLFLAAALLVLPQFIVYFPLRWLLGSSLQHPAWSAIYSILSYSLGLVLLLIVIKYHHRPKSKPKSKSETAPKPHPFRAWLQRPNNTALGLKTLPKLSDLALAPIGLVVYTFLATIVTGLFSKLPFYDASQPQNLGFGSNLYFPTDKILVFISVAIVAPIVEELVFRGWLYARLRARIPGRASMAISILLTSILFGALHGQWNVGVNVFCLSVVLCLLREVTGTIYSGILLHILKNSIAFFLLYMIV